MSSLREFSIAVLPGDGIGPEVTRPCLELLEVVTSAVGGYKLRFEVLEAGAGTYAATGTALPEETFRKAKEADAILLGGMGLPDIRYPDGTEIAPQLDLRERLELFAGVRPVRTIAGAPIPLADPRARHLDFVLVRESTEGLFAARLHNTLEDDSVARDTMVISRRGSEQLFDFAFSLARKRKGTGRPGIVTCVDKANVLPSFAFFRKIFDERSRKYPDIEANHAHVDATALNLVRSPWIFDVIVTENMFGDILSDMGAALVGGMGMAPSADIGDRHAVFQPCHGSAPDIAGTGKANPTAMFLSAAMMLEWLGDRHENESCQEAARLLREAVDRAFGEGGLRPYEAGGHHGTEDIKRRIMQALR